ncbi:GTP cyclohydrolase II [Tulasnella sp. JGI-2019a]|nr:GTP cyclohydrolase II [Tulasnella sp. JGI-2019a]
MSSVPATPPIDQSLHHTVTMDDLAFLDQLTSNPHRVPKFRRREAIFDPLIFAAAVSSGPHITRHHFHHDFFPTDDYHPSDRHPEVGSYDNCDWSGDDIASADAPTVPRYVSHQKPRRERLKQEALHVIERRDGLNDARSSKSRPSEDLSVATSPKKRRPSLLPSHDPEPLQNILKSLDNANTLCPAPHATVSPTLQNNFSLAHPPQQKLSSRPTLVVQCRARTRIPTPHGPVFLHLYHNNWDTKEHLAIVADSAQLEAGSSTEFIAPPIRSRSLDAQWHEGETDMERIIRGAYVGRLSPNSSIVSVPRSSTSSSKYSDFVVPAPMVRIHSECFTGETIGSMRCDCGEQLDEAIRLISQPETIRSSKPNTPSITIPGRGAVVYLRQEGRGIGLLEKIRAYNLQDLGHDTVSANLLLGHGADERGYEIAAAIMRDLGLGAGGDGDGEEAEKKGVRLLTNNPEKMEALEREGIRIDERVAMVPRSWKCGNDHHGHSHSRKQRKARKSLSKRSNGKRSTEQGQAEDESESDAADSDSSHASFVDLQLRRGGATLIGAGAAHGPELERYLRTKVQRMRHMIDIPSSTSQSQSQSSSSNAQSTNSPQTSASTPFADAPSDNQQTHASELAYKMGLVSQNVSDGEDDDEEEEGHAHMSHSIRSLVASTPDLESDRGSVGRLSVIGSRAVSPANIS